MEIASGAIGIFNFAIDCIGRIQLARDFEDDFATYQLKLDLLQIRLSRWGEVAGINNNQISRPAPQPSSNKANGDDSKGTDASPAKKAEEIIGCIEDVVYRAQRDAKKTKAKLAACSDQTLDPESYVPNDLKKIRAKLRECLRRRRAQVMKTASSIKWAFYDKNHLEKFINNISALVTELENLFPEEVQQKLRELSKEECKGISRSNLEELKEIVHECDPWLDGAVDEELKHALGGGTYITQSHNTGMVTGMHYGDINGVSNGNGNKTKNYWGRR
ncbi:uncharacterized protein K452DRAFT_292415 [Aplosporella prunicola CBS 121167]|uniref:Prion-inhibition and propagation HeLo domain-containing protein n=1 Tax=Aplosporella prunicola CBS 121167 TaxID=1176127 RepID=A0A6A6AYU9_9PEZI|nr:uncharacterized protein K452DRAFT_292415 [Aplosporella prunicola CBS 121167]KAF2136438.1 hypothetical protein K452DRAFT_292415 [Aplosporella prunicola CBS 121167]